MTRTVITRWRNLHEPDGERVEIAWSDLFGEFSRPRPVFQGDQHHPGWSPAELDPCRRAAANVRRVFAACLDYDGGDAIDPVLELWRGTFGLLHTTRKHLPDAPRFRVILPWSRPVSPFEHAALWPRIARHAGDKIDRATKDGSRFWFTPGARDPEFFQAIRLEGQPLDPDEWLAKPVPAPERGFGINTGAPTRDLDASERRASAYVARMPEAVSGQGGHGATWNVALTLVKGFGLSESAALRILESEYNPRCVPPWSRRELEHKVRQAGQAQVPDGFKLDDREDWQSRRSHGLPPCPPDDPDYVPEPPEWMTDQPEGSEPVATPTEETEQTRQPGDDTEEVKSAATDARSAWERFGFSSMADLMQLVVIELQKPRPAIGLSTGISDLDLAIGGFRHGNVSVFGAKRGFGKTSYGNLVTSLALERGARVALFAGEDAAIMYGKRLLSMRAGINATLLRDFKVKASDWPLITNAIEVAPKAPFFVRVEGRPVEWIAQAIAELRKETPIDLVIVDYLQCLNTKRRLQDRRNEVTYITKTLSNATKAAGAAGLFFSQLKRGERQEPEIEDLKESGDIEDGADHILLGWREEQGVGAGVRRWIKLGKNKDGQDAAEHKPWEIRFDKTTASFRPDLEPNRDSTYGDYQDGI